ncbi:MAG: hypothetical protein JW836_16130 [Deltaproteobacteria bacterium]|nr:hypothetical protein [Deltaproteobacteria bacterium]
MGVPLKTAKRRRHTTLCSFRQRVRRGPPLPPRAFKALPGSVRYQF